MTRHEALLILTRYMPERSIHITESLDSNYILGDRNDEDKAFVTINPGITKTEPECFIAPTVHEAVTKALDAIGSITFLNIESGFDVTESRFETDQRRAFALLNR